MVLENFYYTDYYKNHWTKYGILFSDKYFEKEKKTILNNNYYIIHKKYFGHIHEKDIIGYDRTLYRTDNNSLTFHYKSDDSKIFKIIKYNNDNEYFIFNRDLSGFSIIDLNNQNMEFNFYNNKIINNDIDNSENGILVFIDCEYLNNKILFYIFYLSKTENNAFKRVFTYLLFDFSDEILNKEVNTIKLLDIRDIVLRKYNHNLDMNYKAYFKNNIIVIEDIMNKKTFELKNNDY
ncbi:hypothetical protein R4K55_06145 [Brachyspira alvinipulli]|uniref:hypothetical protein n=1 Tax=Brachyspira alvinipulli TaxID=84379 RepID=UPI00300562B2